MLNHEISASLLSADWAQLGKSALDIIEAGAQRIHLDVMDNHYVPNLTLGPKACSDLRTFGVKAPIDAHLMVEPVDDLITAFAKAGVNSLSIHPSTSPNLQASLECIHSFQLEAGLVLNPNEPLELIQPYLNQIDRILIMSVYPGFGGQSFISEVLEKVKACRVLIQQNQRNIRLEIDGGINDQTISLAAKAGADTFVSGSYIFSSLNYKARIQKLQEMVIRYKQS